VIQSKLFVEYERQYSNLLKEKLDFHQKRQNTPIKPREKNINFLIPLCPEALKSMPILKVPTESRSPKPVKIYNSTPKIYRQNIEIFSKTSEKKLPVKK
jgi:hypothetical protein